MVVVTVAYALGRPPHTEPRVVRQAGLRVIAVLAKVAWMNNRLGTSEPFPQARLSVWSPLAGVVLLAPL